MIVFGDVHIDLLFERPFGTTGSRPAAGSLVDTDAIMPEQVRKSRVLKIT